MVCSIELNEGTKIGCYYKENNKQELENIKKNMCYMCLWVLEIFNPLTQECILFMILIYFIVQLVTVNSVLQYINISYLSYKHSCVGKTITNAYNWMSIINRISIFRSIFVRYTVVTTKYNWIINFIAKI